MPAWLRSTRTSARAAAWMFTAVNTVKPPILALQYLQLLEAGEPWYAQRLPQVESRIRTRPA